MIENRQSHHDSLIKLKRNLLYDVIGFQYGDTKPRIKKVIKNKKISEFYKTYSNFIDSNEKLNVYLNCAKKFLDSIFILGKVSLHPNLISVTLELNDCSLGYDGAKTLSDNLQLLMNLEYLNINLKNNNVGDTGLTSICQGLEKLLNLGAMKLNLTKNSINGKDKGLQSLKSLLENLERLTVLQLILSNNAISFEPLEEFIPIFEKLEKIESLNLHLDNCWLHQHSVKVLCDGLSKLASCINLHTLHLDISSNYLSDEGCVAFSKPISYFTNLKNLNLNLKDNGIGNIGASEVGKAINNLRLLYYLKINFFFNNIDEKGGTKVCLEIEQLKNLKLLSINFGSNNFSYDGRKKLKEMINSGLNF